MEIYDYNLRGGQNTWLSSIANRLTTLCGKYLYNKSIIDNDEDKEILEKSRKYFGFVKQGLLFKENKLKGFDFAPETLHSINSYKEVCLISSDVEKILEDVDKTFRALEGKLDIDEETMEKSFEFFPNLRDKVRASNYNSEASHEL